VAVRTVTLTKSAYNALVAMKSEQESFSDVVLRLTGSKALLSGFAGAWSGASKEKLESVERFLRESDRLSAVKLRKLARSADRDG
jgi:predicted CopG family antitoxin